ncbi:type I polyketide synthase [Aquisphaera insulae]|uniref:type I polyketide synthase n=1 Tax=Aquisphaera insulae TaxID=2712864 RepID=UPI0013EBA67A|nr:type I polyketide synthase [Aquisphaera insulae]
MSQAIALVGLGCVYPDACSPVELWENVLAGRRAFRRLPPERLRAEDYWSADRAAADRTYSVQAALIEGYEFDRVGFRVSGESYRTADLAHWLALDVAARALKEAGFEGGRGLPRDATGVFLGNTLTGEFSRAQALRLRWPYVGRVVESALSREGWPPERRRDFLGRLEVQFKAPFPPVWEETLAGGLSNTIAGRICNHFDFKGGGYTVDGACASSLLAVGHACSALAAGDLDVALAGGVDLSLDPFELVGFAKAGALAEDAMRVYDARAAGFWPGEGCGVVVLMRLVDAMARRLRVIATIRGWGISSDGRGGITRPEVEGQLLAIRRAYRRAGFGIETVSYFEGHGTGTAVGDATELRALGRAIREAAAEGPPAVVGSIKANIGHTKAAAGVAGLIKAATALDAQLLPPTTGCEQPHPELTADSPPLRILKKGRPWPADRPLRAGVSAMGFGGINVHIVLESPAGERRTGIRPREAAALRSAQDAELFLLGAKDNEGLRARVDHLLAFAPRLSLAEMTDLAAHLAGELEERSARAAIVASRPDQLASRLAALRDRLRVEDAPEGRVEPRSGVFLGMGATPPRIAFLFPGQGSPATLDGGAWTRRFPAAAARYSLAMLPARGDVRSTDLAQPAIVAASLVALGILRETGVEAEVAVGHSLGELVALHWAGSFDADAALRIATARGRAMADLPEGGGAMASIGAERVEVEALLNGEPVVIAGLNARRQTVVSGAEDAVNAVAEKARRRGFAATRLPVSHAFHSPMVASAVGPLARALAREPVGTLERTVISTVTGARLARDVDVRDLLVRQVTGPVRFLEAMDEAAPGVDLGIEVGPGRVLTGLAGELFPAPVVSVEAGSESLAGLLTVLGAAFALGAAVNPAPLFKDRLTRPFPIPWSPRFFINPCELAPLPELMADSPIGRDAPLPPVESPAVAPRRGPTESVLDLVRRRLAARAELPMLSVREDSRLLSDLHLNSITVGELVAELARDVDVAPPVAMGAYANASVAEVAGVLEDLVRAGGGGHEGRSEPSCRGVATWFRAFAPVLIERPMARPRSAGPSGHWQAIAAGPCDSLARELAEALSRAGAGKGLVTCFPPEPDEIHVGLLLQAARALLAEPEMSRFVLVQHQGGAASFARTVQQELPRLATRVVDLPFGDPRSLEWVVAEARAASVPGFSEVRYDRHGRRLEPALRPLPPIGDAPCVPLTPDDVLLVTGGGKGIAAECGLALARESGVRLALMGRSDPSSDRDLAANLERMAASGVVFRYVAADVADADAVRAAVRRAESALGPITSVLHGAGINVPRLLPALDEAAFTRTLAPKIRGMRNILAAIPGDRLRLLVTFGSIIARTGMEGEADYAVSNEWLARLTERFQERHPACHCLALEWSVWAGLGMGDRLGRVESLVGRGITAIPPDEGVSLFRRLVSVRQSAVSLVVAGRFGNRPILPLEGADLPLLRFLEEPRVDYPGVELIADATLSPDTDPYLDDHVFRGERLFPAVMGLEAMAQVAMALLRTTEPPVFEDVRFDRPVVVSEGQPAVIRIAALVTEPGRVDVVLRCHSTAFQLDHFGATCRFGVERGPRSDEGPSLDRDEDPPALSIEPQSELYGHLLFQGGRFRRLKGYRRLRSKGCTAMIAGAGVEEWFRGYLPAERVLGDPGVRDAAVHAVQACMPQATILPIGVDRIVPGSSPLGGPCLVTATERSDRGDVLVYDLEMIDEDGQFLERWEGLALRVVERGEPSADWPEPLLGPYLERRMRSLVPGWQVAVGIERDVRPGRRDRSDGLLRRLRGDSSPIARRPDGKPEVAGGGASASHAGGLTLGVTGPGTIACDLESCSPRPASAWRDLLGPDRWDLARLIVRESREPEDLAATRVWVAAECLIKAGAEPAAPLVLRPPVDGRAVLMGSGRFLIATFVLPDRGGKEPWVVGLLTRPDDARV